MTDAEFNRREDELRAKIARMIDEVSARRARRIQEFAFFGPAALAAAAAVAYGLFA